MKILETQACHVPEIVALHIACWQTNFVGLMHEESLRLIREKESEWVARRYEHVANRERIKLVAQDDSGKILGFCDGGKPRDPRFSQDGELYALYVHPDEQGKQIGAALLGEMKNRLKAAGFPRMYLKTFFKNQASRGFYEKMGGTFAGEGTLVFDGREYPEAFYLYSLN